MLIRVGSAEVGGLIEVVEWDEPNDLAWSSVTGIDQRGRLRLRAAGTASTRVELRYQYGVAGAGLVRLDLGARRRRRRSRRHLRTSLQQLKRVVEHEKLRAEAAARSAERAA